MSRERPTLNVERLNESRLLSTITPHEVEKFVDFKRLVCHDKCQLKYLRAAIKVTDLRLK